jgi:hypothetical protein
MAAKMKMMNILTCWLILSRILIKRPDKKMGITGAISNVIFLEFEQKQCRD